jgi:tetratricopeptide (TPR) repeat protein
MPRCLDPSGLENTLRRKLPSIIPGLLASALQHHQAGRLREAERIYRLILDMDARHADSLHLLGMIEYQAGRHETAMALIRRAIAIDPTQAAYPSNLGTIFHALGQLDEAAACYRQALTLHPELAKAHFNLGNVFHTQEKLDEAAASYARALAIDPQLADAHYNLGNVLQAQRQWHEAIACYERALEIDPGKHEALHNLGNALQAQDKLQEAIACYEQVMAVQPRYAKAHFSLGGALHALGDLDGALAQYGTALSLDPGFAEAAFAEALARLARGEFSAGWRGYERRWQTPAHRPRMRMYRQPLWAREKLARGKLLLWGEQGVGDEVMFAGLVPDAIRTGNHCMLDCDARLKPLFARSFPEVEVVASRGSVNPADRDSSREADFSAEPDLSKYDPGDDSAPEIAAHLPSGSLPRLFRATDAAFAATQSPYLVADPAERAQFRARYADGRRLVGLAWYTNNWKTGRIRSIDLRLFAPLFAHPGLRWISLQYGDHDSLEDEAAAAGAPLLIDRSVDQFANLDLFAAQIAAMDLVITIDNSTAHLAGALGVPTWLLLPLVSDWRWLLRREDSPWYPTLRLFRQPERGNWKSAINSIEHSMNERSEVEQQSCMSTARK